MNKARHIAIAVRDIDKSLAFYRDLLGLEVLRKLERKDGGVTIDLSDGEVNIVLSTPPKGVERRFGLNHMGFLTDDINTMHNKLKEMGVKFLDESDPEFLKVEDPNGILIDISSRPFDRF